MHIAYWIIAAVLAVFYLYAGGKKVAQDQQTLAPMMAWAGTTVPMPVVRFIGVVEIVGAIGLIAPPATGITPVLAVVAAAGFTVLQILAAALHLSRGEVKETGLNAVLIVLSGVATWLATSF